MKTQHSKTGDAVKVVVLRRKFIAVNACIKKQRPQVRNLTFHLKVLEEKEETKLKASRR